MMDSSTEEWIYRHNLIEVAEAKPRSKALLWNDKESLYLFGGNFGGIEKDCLVFEYNTISGAWGIWNEEYEECEETRDRQPGARILSAHWSSGFGELYLFGGNLDTESKFIFLNRISIIHYNCFYYLNYYIIKIYLQL